MAIPDLTAMAEANDFVALFAKYGAPAIDSTAQYRGGGSILGDLQQKVLAFQASYRSNSRIRDDLEVKLEYMKTQTPIYNAAGDQATIEIGPTTEALRAANLTPEITFIKRDGRWYLKSGNPFGW